MYHNSLTKSKQENTSLDDLYFICKNTEYDT